METNKIKMLKDVYLSMQKHPNRFELMEETHPKLYRYCMEKLWLRKIIDYIESQGKIW